MADSKKLTSVELRLVQANQERWSEQVQDLELDILRLVQIRRTYGEMCMRLLEKWLSDLKNATSDFHPDRIQLIFRDLRVVLDARWVERMEKDVLPMQRKLNEDLLPLTLGLPSTHVHISSRIRRSLADEIQQWIDLRLQISGLLVELERNVPWTK